MKKRLLSMILALGMMLTILPVNAITAWAADDMSGDCGLNKGNNVTYVLTQNNDDTTNPTYTLTIKGNGEMADFKESDMEGRAPWIAQKEKITAVTIENGVTYVGAYAFDHCKKLTQITIHAQLNSIGKGAFRDCEGLTSIEIPKTVTSIGASAFSGCKGLSNIEIPETVVSIGGAAFNGCTGLTSIKIPATVTSIKEYTFNECSNLKNVEIPQGVVSIGECAFSECGILESIEIPQNVTSIGENAFFGCKTLTSIKIPAKVTSISKGILSGCSNLKDVEILGAVTSIGDNAFMSCGQLTDIKIPDTVTSIGKNAFYMSGLTSIKIPNTVTSIGEYAFYVCNSLAKIEMPANMPSISQYTFYRTTTTVDETRVFYYPGYRHDWDQQVSKISANGNTDLLANDYERVHYYCDVIFNSNGGTFTDGSNTKTIKEVWRKEHLTQEQINSVGKPTKDGKMFIGWNTTQDATTVIDPKSDYIADGKIYYAVYKDAVPAVVTIDGLDGTTVKAGEVQDFTVSVTPNDDTINKVTFDTTSGEVQWSSDNGNTWTTVSGDVDYSDLTGKQFRVVPAADAANGTVTVTITAKKADGTEVAKNAANFTVTAREHATVEINDLNGETIKQSKPHTFTVTVTAHDDSGETTLKFDNVAGLTHNGTAVTDAGVTVALTNQPAPLTFTLTPDAEGAGKTLTATLNNGATDTATYTVSEYEHAKVTIEGLGDDLKQGESKDFTVKVDPKDDSGNAIIDFGDKNSEIQYKDGEDWKPMPSGGLKINLSNGEKPHDFRITPKNDGSQTLTATVKQNDNELDRVEQTYTVAKKDEPTTPGGGENPGGGSTGGSENPGENPGGGSTGGGENPGGGSGNTKPTPKPDEKPDRKIKIDGGIVEVNGKEVKPDEDGNITVKKGDEITVTVDKSKISDAQVFDQWVIKPDSVLNEVDPKSEKISFTMPAEDVTIEAMTRDASIEDDGPGILGTGALIATGFVGSAALLYQGHMLGTELYLRYLLPHGAVIPQNRAELAVLLWQDAENPEPVSTTLYSDISDEDSAIQQAARWAVENDLMEQLDADEHPDHFDPFVPVTFSDSIRAWKKAQELKKSVH